MKIALVHDDLVQFGGAERILIGLAELFPDAPIYTSLFDRNNKELKHAFAGYQIRNSFLQNIPGWRTLYKSLLPLYPLAFESFDLSEFDLVISQTTRFAKVVITKPKTIHICYCHTPPRFLWNLPGGKFPGVFSPYINLLRLFDQIASNRVDFWIAGSKNAQDRIKKFYHVQSEVIEPFINLEDFKNLSDFNGGYYLIIARLNDYKKIDLAVSVFNNIGLKLKVVGTGPELHKLIKISKDNVQFLGNVSDSVKLNLIAGCKALIITAEEDFGLTSLEAQAAGKPVLAYGEGGAKETIIDGKTGLFFEAQDTGSLENSIKSMERIKFDPLLCKQNAAQFSKSIFQKRILDFVNRVHHK